MNRLRRPSLSDIRPNTSAPAGTALLERARQRRDERISAIIEPWQHAERAQFAELLDRFTAGYEQSHGVRRPDPSHS